MGGVLLLGSQEFTEAAHARQRGEPALGGVECGSGHGPGKEGRTLRSTFPTSSLTADFQILLSVSLSCKVRG